MISDASAQLNGKKKEYMKRCYIQFSKHYTYLIYCQRQIGHYKLRSFNDIELKSGGSWLISSTLLLVRFVLK